MWLKNKIQNITKNFTNLVATIKSDVKEIKNTLTTVFKVIILDRVDVIVFVIAILLSVFDFFTTWDLTGALALLTFYISGLLFRLAIWKLKANNKND